MIMADDWFGHRHPFTGEPFGDKDEWTDWDFVLVEAVQLIEDWTDQHGLLAWEVDDPKERVQVVAKPRIDKFEQQREIMSASESRGNKKPPKGRYYVPVVDLMKPATEWPGHQEYFEWLASQKESP